MIGIIDWILGVNLIVIMSNLFNNFREEQSFELFLSMDLVSEQQQFSFWIKLFRLGSNLSLQPIHKILHWVLQKNSLLRYRCSFWNLNHVIIPKASFHWVLNDIFKILAHTEQLYAIWLDMIWLLSWWNISWNVQTLIISYVIISNFSPYLFMNFLLEFESERVLQPE